MPESFCCDMLYYKSHFSAKGNVQGRYGKPKDAAFAWEDNAMRDRYGSGGIRGFRTPVKVFVLFTQLIGVMGTVLCFASCAQGGRLTNPVIPGDGGQVTANQRDGFTEYEAAIDISDGEMAWTGAGHELWGFFAIYVNPGEMKADIISLRETASHFNVLSWLEAGPCYSCVEIAGVAPGPGGSLNIDISITHPFSNLNLTGFDVRGIAMFDGSHEFPAHIATTSDRSAGEGELVNADGYTRLYNPSTARFGPFQGFWKGGLATNELPSSTLNGYKRFISDRPDNTRNAFWPSDTVTVTYQVDMPDSPNPFVFGYAVDASWAPPLTKPVTDPMTQFPVSANCPEAWKIEVSETPVGEGLTDCGGVTKLTIDVYDRQEKDTGHDVLVECPELFENSITASWKEDGDGFTRYEAAIWNSEHAPEGSYMCLVSKQEDWPNNHMDPSAFYIHTLNVVKHADSLPTAVAEVSGTVAATDEPIGFDASASHDNDCDGQGIVKYEWDWLGAGDFVEGSAMMDHSWDTPGEYHVGLRVTDDEGNTDTFSDLPVITVQAKQSHNWTRTFGGPGEEHCHSIAVDASGNIYATGSFAGTVDFDPGSGTEYHSSNGYCDAFLSKFNSSGVFQWAQTWSGNNYAQGLGVAADDSGNIYVASCLYCGVIETRKFDSSGELKWSVITLGCDVESCGIAVDFSGHVYIASYFSYFLKDPDWDYSQRSAGGMDAFLIKYNSLGSYMWSRAWGGEEDDKSLAIAIARSNYVYVTGSFEHIGGVDFDPEEHEHDYHYSEGGSDVFITKFSPSGDYQWARTWGGSEDEEGLAIDVDGTIDIYVAGTFRDAVDFDPGDGVEMHGATGYCDSFLSKFNSAGAFQNTMTWGGTGYTRPHAVSADGSGNIYVAGSFTGTTDFDPGDYVYEFVSSGSWDVFLSKIDSSGALEWVKTWGGSGSDRGYGVALDELENVYVGGCFRDTVDFDPGCLVDNYSSNGLRDVFLSSLQSD